MSKGRALRCAAFALLLSGLAPSLVFANPEGGVVSAGSATINPTSPTQLDIVQHTDRAVIDWGGFDIRAGEHTQFHQPSQHAVALNRVHSTGASNIDGRLSANGNVIIINQNGIVFGKNAVVDVNGLVASTADIANDTFMQGGLHFDRPGKPDATIENKGSITAKQAGLVGLVAPNVINSGVITARLGRVHLASGDTHTVDLYGDGLMEVKVSDAVKSQLVEHTGVIRAEGGVIALTAAAGREMVNSVVKVDGALYAPSVGTRQGRIIIAAEGSHAVAGNDAAAKGKRQGSSTVIVTGKLDVSGGAAGAAGTVQITADHIVLKGGSHIDASGALGGGVVHVGGEYLGQGATPVALSTVMEQAAVINASATGKGHGGQVVMYAAERTEFRGSIEAMGGAQGGNGGFVETSGRVALLVRGQVRVGARRDGEAGEWLLDPANVYIIRPGGNAPGVPSGEDYTISADSIQAALNGGANVTITTINPAILQAGDITVAASIAWTTDRTLTLQAERDIIIDAPITGRNITLQAGRDVDINANLATNLAGQGQVSIYTFTGGTIGIGTGAAGALHLSTEDLGYIQPGFRALAIGSTVTSAIDMRATSWQHTLVVSTASNGSITVNGAQAMNNQGVNLHTGTLTVNQAITGISYTSSHGVFTADRHYIYAPITAPGAGIYFHFLSSAAQAPVITADITSSLGIGFISSTAWNLSLGVGSAASGDIVISDTVLGYLKAPGLNFGGTPGAWHTYNWKNIEVAARDWTVARPGGQSLGFGNSGRLEFLAGNHKLGAGALSLYVDALPVMTGSISAFGALTLASSVANRSFGFGNNATGDVVFNTAYLANLQAMGFSQYSVYAYGTGNVSVGDASWNKALFLGTEAGGKVTLSGAVTMNSNSLEISSGSLDLSGTLSRTTGSLRAYMDQFSFTGNITGTGLIRIGPRGSSGSTLGLGDSASGALKLTNAQIARLQALGLDELQFYAGQIDVRQLSWSLPRLTLLGNIHINGAQDFGNSSVRFDIFGGATGTGSSINHAITGTGALTIRGHNSQNLYIGSGATGGTISLNDASLANIGSGFSSVEFSTTNSGLFLNRLTAWNFAPTFLASGSGAITVQGAQNFGARNVRFATNDLNLNAPITGTGSLRFVTDTATAGIGIGDGAAGALHFSNAELGNILFPRINFGDATLNSLIDIRAYSWQSSPIFETSDMGAVTVNGAQTMNNRGIQVSTGTFTTNHSIAGIGGINALLAVFAANRHVIYAPISTNGRQIFFHFQSDQARSPVITADVTAEEIQFHPAGSARSLSIGVGSAASGDIILSDAVLGYLKTPSLSIGGVEGSYHTYNWKNIEVAARDWTIARPGGQSLRFGNSGRLEFLAGNHKLGAGNLTLYVNAAPILTGNISASGQFFLAASLYNRSFGFGDNATGDVLFDTAYVHKLNAIGFSQYNLTTYGTGNLSLGDASWNKTLKLTLAQSGGPPVSGAVTAHGATSVQGELHITAPMLTILKPLQATQAITLLVDALTIGSGYTVSTPGKITVAPRTDISFGVGATSGYGFNLDNTTISRMVAGSYQFGTVQTAEGASRATDVSLRVDVAAAGLAGKDVTVVSGRDLTVDAAFTRAAGDTAKLTLEAVRNITVNAPITLRGGDLLVRANSQGSSDGSSGVGAIAINAALATNGGKITLGGGNGSITGGSGYAVGNDALLHGVDIVASVDAGGGMLIINGMGHKTRTANHNYGVWVHNAAVVSSTGGAIRMNGIGGGAGASSWNYGILVTDTSSAIAATGGAQVLLVGQGGTGSTGDANYGISINAAGKITADGAGTQLELRGTGGGAGASRWNYGILVIDTNSAITATNKADVLLIGQGGPGNTGNGNYGILVHAAGKITAEGVGTKLELQGTGGGTGASDSNHGIFVSDNSAIAATGGAQVLLIGQGGTGSTGNANYGIFVNAAGKITANGAGTKLELRGTGGGAGASGTHYGIAVSDTNSAIAATGGAEVLLIGQGGTGGTGNTNNGILVQVAGKITADGVDTKLELRGTGGGAGAGEGNYGIYIIYTNSAIAATGGAQVLLIGQGGTGSTGIVQHGILVAGANITAEGVGTKLELQGTGGGTGASGGNYGIHVSSANSAIAATGGAQVLLIGQGGTGSTGNSHYGIVVSGAGKITAEGGGHEAGIARHGWRDWRE